MNDATPSSRARSAAVTGHHRSRLARLQQVVVTLTLCVLALWITWAWGRSAWLLWLGAGMLVGGYALVLAVEFVLVAAVNRKDPVPRATSTDLVRAWWAEVGMAPRVFSWRQPFRWRAWPDDVEPRATTYPAVVFVHGFVCNRGFWLPWMREMRARGIPYASVNLEPVFASIDDYVAVVDEAVRRAQALTGGPPLLVCHSMGGLAVRAWRAAIPNADQRVRHIVTIGSPHQGTWLGRFSHVPNGQQMRQNSEWLRGLAAKEAQRWPQGPYSAMTCWYSNADNIVFPASTATLPGADNRLIPGQAHVAMAFHPRIMAETWALLSP